MAVCGLVRCALAQPLAPCLPDGDIAYTALDEEGWRCVGVPGLGLTTPPRAVSSPLRMSLDKSVPFYRLFPYRSAPPPPPPFFPFPGPPLVDPLLLPPGAARGAASGGAASGGAEPGGAESEGAGSGGAEPGGAEPAGVEPGGAKPVGVEPGGAESEGAESGGAEPRGTTSSGGPTDTRAGGARVTAGAGGSGGVAAAGPRGARTRGTGADGSGGVGGAGGTGAGGAGVGGAGAIDPGAGGARASPVRTGRRVPRAPPPHFLGTHAIELRPSFILLRAPLPPPPKSSLPAVPDPESHCARAATPTVSCLLATVVTNPSFESTSASDLVVEQVDFAAVVTACRLDYACALVAESESASPSSVGGECALGTDVLKDRQEDFECLPAAVPRFASMLLAPEKDPDAPDIPTPRSYAEAIEVPTSRANIVDGMWIFRVKRPPGSPPALKGRYIARGFSERQGVDYFQTFSLTPKTTTLWVLLHVTAQRDYELHSLDFSTPFLQGSLHEEIWLRLPPGVTGSFPAGPSALWLPVLLATVHSSVYQLLALSFSSPRPA
ncbi:unnamed protein product [Closterium sp. NIES-53]